MTISGGSDVSAGSQLCQHENFTRREAALRDESMNIGEEER
jgi:hypothetical protein